MKVRVSLCMRSMGGQRACLSIEHDVGGGGRSCHLGHGYSSGCGGRRHSRTRNPHYIFERLDGCDSIGERDCDVIGPSERRPLRNAAEVASVALWVKAKLVERMVY